MTWGRWVLLACVCAGIVAGRAESARATPDLAKGPYPKYRIPGKRWPATMETLLPLQTVPPIPKDLPYRKGMFVYRDDDLGNRTILKYGFQPPLPEMAIDKLVAFGTPGERLTTWLKILPDADGLVPSLKLGSLRNQTGDVLDPGAVRVFRIRRWLQQYGKAKYYVSPLPLEPMDRRVRRTDVRGYAMAWEWRPRRTLYDVDRLQWVEVDTARMRRHNPECFFIALRLPPDARPGLYSGTIALVKGETPLAEMPFHVRVMDFQLMALPPAVKGWCMWGWPADFESRLPQVSDAQMDRVLRRLREAGIESMDIGNSWLKDPAYKPRFEKGRMVSFESPRLDRWLRAIKRAGLKGHLIMDVGHALEYNAVGRFLNLPQKSLRDVANWPPELKTAIVDFAKALRRKMDAFAMPWALKPGDEPHSHSPERFDVVLKLLHEECPDLPIGVTLSPEALERWGFGLNPRYSAIYAKPTNPAGEAIARKWARGRPLGVGMIGCWQGMMGSASHNRRRGGLEFWARPFKTTMHIWTWEQGIYDYYNTFDHGALDRYMTAPPQDALRTDEPFLSTPQWEGIRDAVTDCRYAYTLEQGIARALKSSSPVRQALAQQIQKDWRELLANLAPDAASAEMHNYRWWMAHHIDKLRRTKKPHAAKPGAAVAPKEFLRLVRTGGTEEGSRRVTYRPKAIRPLAAPIVLDGRPDPAWRAIDPIHLGGRMPGQSPTAPTEVRLAYHDGALYMLATCREPRMADRHMPKAKGNSSAAFDGEVMEVFLRPNLLTQEYVQFAANGVGTWFARRYEGPRRPLASGAAPPLRWQVAGRLEKDRWTVEGRIPLDGIFGSTVSDFVGIGLARTRRGKKSSNEYMCAPFDVFHRPTAWQAFQILRHRDTVRVEKLSLPLTSLIGRNRIRLDRPLPVSVTVRAVDGDVHARTTQTAEAVDVNLPGPGAWQVLLEFGKAGREPARFSFRADVQKMTETPQVSHRVAVAGERPAAVAWRNRLATESLSNYRLVAQLDSRGEAAEDTFALGAPMNRLLISANRLPPGRWNLHLTIARPGRPGVSFYDGFFHVIPSPCAN